MNRAQNVRPRFLRAGGRRAPARAGGRGGPRAAGVPGRVAGRIAVDPFGAARGIGFATGRAAGAAGFEAGATGVGAGAAGFGAGAGAGAAGGWLGGLGFVLGVPMRFSLFAQSEIRRCSASAFRRRSRNHFRTGTAVTAAATRPTMAGIVMVDGEFTVVGVWIGFEAK